MKNALIVLLIFCAAGFTQEIGARYLIITPDIFYNDIQPLSQWKHKKGMRTKVVKLSEIGSSASEILNYITDAYNNWQIPPEFLLLVGAPNYLQFPTVGGIYTDNYYGNMNGDIYNEILPGRLTVHNTTEAQTVVNKILLYERTPYMDDSLWFINACMIVREDYDPPDDSIYWSDANHAKNLMLSAGYDSIDTLSRIAGHNTSHVIQAVNAGRAFVMFRGQGVGNWWSPFDVNPDATANGAKLPIVLSITCKTIGTSSTPATAEKWLLTGSPTTPRGGAGYFATTTTLSGGAHLRSAVCKGFFSTIFEDGNTTFGGACEGGRKNVYTMYGSSSEYRGFATLGDPEMNIWTAIPKPVDVSHISSLSVDDESLSILVELNSTPLESALVCIVLLDSVIYQSGITDNNGNITFYFDSLIPGEMDITVTGNNILPYETTIPIIATDIYLTYCGHTINDSLANNNGFPESGETILLQTIIKNIGGSTAQNVIATLSTDNILISIIDSVVSFGNIYSQDSSFGSSPFVFSISPFYPGGDTVDFDLSMSDASANTWTSNFSIIINSFSGATGPDQYGYYIYDDTDTLSGNAPVFDWFEIAPSPGTIVSEITNEDADTVTLPLPFTFTYYGEDYNTIGVCSNGFTEFPTSTYRFGDFNTGIPDPAGPRAMLAPFWDDLDPSEAGNIYQYYDDIEHRWIFEFYEVDHYGGPGHFETFQVILLDPQYYPTPTGDGEILYLYSNVADATNNTVGIEDETEQRGLQYLYNNTYDANAAPLVSNRALLITTKPPAGTYNTPWLHIIDYTINDSAGGNNNGIVEPNETIDVYISIKNDGDTSAYNVTGILRGNDNDAEVIDSISSFGDLAVGGTANNIGDAYTVHVSNNPADSTIGFSLQLECNGGTYNKTDYFTIYIYGLPGVEEQELLGYDQSFGLQIFPNPFRNSVDIRWQTENIEMQDVRSKKQDISLKIYDVSGRIIRSFNLASCLLLPASSVSWDGIDNNGRQVASGIYFISLDIDDYKQIKKVVLLK
ncbi:hypothetical protein ES705_12467 [subsurface metagenome]